MPGYSQVLLYLGEEVPEDAVTVPDFLGMQRQQAADAAASAGLFLLVAGNDSLDPAVINQSVAAGSSVARGSTIELTFADNSASD